VRSDRWSRWLLERRDGGDERQREVSLAHLSGVRDRVLGLAEPLEGATLLDVGTGDGLIGLSALDRVGPRGRVIFSDVSEPLLEECRAAVRMRGADERAAFVTTAAEDLEEIPDSSVDVVTTRSVLIYVADKPRAFAALHRVLRPGGRVSLFEPINRLMFPDPDGRFYGYDLSAVSQLTARVDEVLGRFDSEASRAAMLDFDDRDLLRLAEQAGFEPVHVECHLDVGPGSLMSSVSLEALLDSAPNPNAPTIREAVEVALDAAERREFLAELGRAFAEATPVRRLAGAYLAATKGKKLGGARV
jgi:ubiquinone/menaquinone biosynthesis C-methylase UbiE